MHGNKKAYIWFDGFISKNPGGLARYGFVIRNSGKLIYKGSGDIGKGEGMTVNVAEYSGLINGIKKARELGYKNLEIYGDSFMVIAFVRRRYFIKKNRKKWHGNRAHHLNKYLDKVGQLLEGIKFNINWITREENKEADSLSKPTV